MQQPQYPQIQRPHQRRSGWGACACGCLAAFSVMLVLLVIGVVLIAPRLPNIVAQVSGMQLQGETVTQFQATVVPTPQIQNVVIPDQVTLNLGELGTRSVSNATAGVTLQTGSDTGGAPLAIVSFDEAGLMQICRERTTACNASGVGSGMLNNVSLDLKPGGVIVYADASLPELAGFSQRVGVVLQLDGSSRSFEFAGVDINGSLFSLPPDNFGINVNEFVSRGNALLNQVALSASGENYTLSQVSITESELTVILR